MSALFTSNKRVVSGMRVSGKLHLGHYHGVLKNWIKLQHQYDCFFFAADWHAVNCLSSGDLDAGGITFIPSLDSKGDNDG